MLLKRILRIAVVALVAWAVFSCVLGCKPKVDEPAWDVCSNELGQHPCDFKMMDQNGKQVNLYDHYGKVIILDFSAMWCGPCMMAAMDADEIVKKFGEDNVVYITVLIENSSGDAPIQKNLEDWAEAFGIEINPVLAGSREWLAESDYHLEAWPTFYFINSKMIIKEYQRGYSKFNVEGAVQKLLPQNTDTGE